MRTPTDRRDARAVSPLIGFMLLFAILVLAAASFQTFAIPAANAEIEFDDYGESTEGMIDLRNALLATAADGNTRRTSVKLGTRYPNRLVFLNPAAASGRLTTAEEGSLRLSNVRGAGSRQNVGTFLDSEGNQLAYDTRSVVFEPNYNEYTDAGPVVIDGGGVVYHDHANPVLRSSQTLIDGNRITLPSVGGSVDRDGESATLTSTPRSPHKRSITVTGQGGDDVELELESRLSEGTWETLLADEIDPGGADPDRHVLDVTKSDPDHVRIVLDGDQRYTLRASHTVLSERDDAAEGERPAARYLVSETDRNTRTGRDGRLKLVLEARDAYNNPVSNAPVAFESGNGVGTFEAEDGTAVSGGAQATVRTDDDGRAVVWFNATDQLGTLPLTARLEGTSDPEKRASYQVFNSVSSGAEGGGADGEQAGRSLVTLQGVTTPVTATQTHVTFQVRNRGFPTNVTGYRLDYAYALSSQGRIRDGPSRITSVSFDGNPAIGGSALERGAPHFLSTDQRYTLAGPMEDTTVRINFDNGLAEGDGGGDPRSVFVSIGIYLDGDRTTTYTFQLPI